ncbi:MAG: cbb3-type cytochrome oxidase assembly protein CcoS [Burkholderiales bacterium]
MEILYLLVPLSVVLVLATGAVFWLALASGQFDDLDTPGLKILADDDLPSEPEGGFDVDQMRPKSGRYDGPLASRGAAEPRGATDAGTGNV